MKKNVGLIKMLSILGIVLLILSSLLFFIASRVTIYKLLLAIIACVLGIGGLICLLFIRL